MRWTKVREGNGVGIGGGGGRDKRATRAGVSRERMHDDLS